MSVFEKWIWIKRNWTYILEEANKLNLVFVGGTALNLAIFKEYRASEDIDLYDPHSKTIGTAHEEESIKKLAKNLTRKGFEIKSRDERALWVGPNIKIEVFNDGTPFTKIERKTFDQTEFLVFDIKTYAEMKMSALLCRSFYDARDLVDLFIIKKETEIELSFPKIDCEVIENSFNERLEDIKKTKKEDLLIFQTMNQVNDLPYEEFEKFKRWLHDWLSRFR
ncbi:MAG: nucleotidyl transferase AbiEii/AbiGii toxin family protein [Thermoplasmata archaeon]|nr:nucleotidyl transferase AbiEii/AbiGii toxin family protein [Thermoplasmata archaeon]